MQSYLYDSSGRLRQVWNPQVSPALKTEYEYDTAGRVTKLTPSGELAWTFTYGKAGNAATAGDGMLLKATRPGLKQGTAGTIEGEAATSVVYDVPLTGTTAPYTMGAGDVKAWGQLDAPTDATAVFPADAVPASHSGSALTAADYKRADVHYLAVSGREVNTATPGGHISTTEYDRFGNTVRELSAANRAVALGLTASDQATQADLGIAQLTTAERADLLTTRSVYNSTGTRELEEFGPLRRIDLTADLKSGTTTLVTAGTSVTARTWTVNEYDAGRPTDGTAKVKDQITKVAAGAEVREHPGILRKRQRLRLRLCRPGQSVRPRRTYLLVLWLQEGPQVGLEEQVGNRSHRGRIHSRCRGSSLGVPGLPGLQRGQQDAEYARGLLCHAEP